MVRSRARRTGSRRRSSRASTGHNLDQVHSLHVYMVRSPSHSEDTIRVTTIPPMARAGKAAGTIRGFDIGLSGFVRRPARVAEPVAPCNHRPHPVAEL